MEFAHVSVLVVRCLGRLVNTDEDAVGGKVFPMRSLEGRGTRGFLTIRRRGVIDEAWSTGALVSRVVAKFSTVVEGVNSIDSFSAFFVFFVDDI